MTSSTLIHDVYKVSYNRYQMPRARHPGGSPWDILLSVDTRNTRAVE